MERASPPSVQNPPRSRNICEAIIIAVDAIQLAAAVLKAQKTFRPGASRHFVSRARGHRVVCTCRAGQTDPVLRSFETSFKPLAFSHCGSHRPLHRRERSRLSSAPCFLQRWSGMKYPACGDRDWSASLSSLRRPRQVAPFCAPAPILEPAFESAFRRSALPPLFAEAGIRHRRPISAPGRDPNPSVQNRCFARIVCEEIFECSWRTHSNLNVRDPIRRDKRKGGDREEIREGNG